MTRSDMKLYNKMCKLYEAGEYDRSLLLAQELYYDRLTLFDNKNIVIDVLIVLYECTWKRGSDIRKLFPMLARIEYTRALEYLDIELKMKGENKWGDDLTNTIEEIVLDITNEVII